LAGNAFRGVAMNACIADAKKISQTLKIQLRPGP
jgi:hypothetical protein